MLLDSAKDPLLFSVIHFKHPKQPHTVQVNVNTSNCQHFSLCSTVTQHTLLHFNQLFWNIRKHLLLPDENMLE